MVLLPSQALTDYIRNQINAGYDIKTIRTYLYNQGYNLRDIDDAINAAQPITPTIHKHELVLSKSTIAILSSLIIAAAIIIYLIISMLTPSAPEQLLDVTLDPLSTTAIPGGKIEFVRSLINLGSLKRFDFPVSYEITERNTGVQVVYQEETIGVETSMASTKSLLLPTNLNPGIYDLKAETIYDGQIASASFMFTIISQPSEPTCFDNIKNQNEQGIDCGGPCTPCPSCSDNIQNGDETGLDCGGSCPPCKTCPICDDNNRCTVDLCNEQTSFECLYEPIEPCCGNNNCEAGESASSCPSDCTTVEVQIATSPSPVEIISKVKETTNIEESIELCDQIDVKGGSRNYDRCYSIIAQNSNDFNYCASIFSPQRRDQCYMGFALKGYLDVCERIRDPFIKQSCDSLQYIQQ